MSDVAIGTFSTDDLGAEDESPLKTGDMRRQYSKGRKKKRKKSGSKK